MANTLLTPTAVTRAAAAILHQKLNFVGACNKQYDDSYKNGGATVKGKFGPTLKVRLPNQYTVRSGLSMSAQDTTESSVDLTVSTVKGVDMNFTSTELALSLEDFSQRIIEPAMSVLAANIEADALSMYKEVYNLVDGDTVAFGYNSVSDANSALTTQLAPMGGRSMLMPPTHANKFRKDTKGLYTPTGDLGKVFRDGALGNMVSGFDLYENTLLVPHQTGTAAKTTGYLINGSVSSGATSVPVDTGTTTFLAGDVVTFAGCFRVHPETKVSTGDLQQFVVTANSGTSATSLAISPTIFSTGAAQNVTNVPADNSAVVKVGAGASETLIQSLAFHKDAFAFVTADLPLPEGTDFAAREVVDGISVSIVRDFAISDRTFPCRLDVLYGYKAIRPMLATRVHNDG